MLHLLRVLFLVIVAGLLVEAVIRIATGTTGTVEKFVVASIACLWTLAASREWRELRLGTLNHKAD
jgi:uncharacterized membrane protein YqjE